MRETKMWEIVIPVQPRGPDPKERVEIENVRKEQESKVRWQTVLRVTLIIVAIAAAIYGAYKLVKFVEGVIELGPVGLPLVDENDISNGTLAPGFVSEPIAPSRVEETAKPVTLGTWEYGAIPFTPTVLQTVSATELTPAGELGLGAALPTISSSSSVLPTLSQVAGGMSTVISALSVLTTLLIIL